MLSPFAMHRNYRLSRTHVADIREPAVRALWFYRYAKRVASDAGSMPSDPDNRAAWDDLAKEVRYAMKRCNDIIAKERDARKLERHSERTAA